MNDKIQSREKEIRKCSQTHWVQIAIANRAANVIRKKEITFSSLAWFIRFFRCDDGINVLLLKYFLFDYLNPKKQKDEDDEKRDSVRFWREVMTGDLSAYLALNGTNIGTNCTKEPHSTSTACRFNLQQHSTCWTELHDVDHLSFLSPGFQFLFFWVVNHRPHNKQMKQEKRKSEHLNSCIALTING